MRGAFYSYFDSKSDLYAEELECFFTDPGWDNSWKGIHIDLTAVDIGPQIVRAYLSRQQLQNIANSCPMVALPSDVARSGPSAKKAFERVFKAMVRTLERGLQSAAPSRRTAAQASPLCVLVAWSQLAQSMTTLLPTSFERLPWPSRSNSAGGRKPPIPRRDC